MIDKEQLRGLVERTLQKYDGLYSDAAVNLVMGTIAQESAFGTYIRQVRGPALGISQVERPTFEWLKSVYAEKYGLHGITFESLEWDLSAAILFCRLRYRVDKNPLPDADDIPGLAMYWKRIYNTSLGRGNVVDFIKNYRKYIG